MNTLNDIVNKQREFYRLGETMSYDFRISMLSELYRVLRKNEKDIAKALYDDLNKSPSESYLTEISIVYETIEHAMKHLKAWMSPKKAGVTISNLPSSNYILSEPYGVVAIMAPWNYPYNLSLVPLIGAMAAGNTSIVKGSRSAKHTSTLLAEIINNTFPPEYIYFTRPEIDYSELLDPKYDYIFFTGAQKGGRTVMAHAAEHLTPITLELGGKSPCFIDEDADISLAAKRIAWGKFLNAGQTCIAIDYILVHRKIVDKLVKALIDEIASTYPKADTDPTFPKIITNRHYRRLKALLQSIPEGRTLIGGKCNDDHQKIAPALVLHSKYADPLMEEEIFGPILPIITYDDLGEAIDHVKHLPKPLACYFFSENMRLARNAMKTLSFGGGCINDVIMHIGNINLPFGGVGDSGMGMYHGKYSFDTFSHIKSIVETSTTVDMPFRYRRFSEKNLNLLKKLIGGKKNYHKD